MTERGRDEGTDVALDGAKLAAARLWATNRFPYLAAAIFASPALAAPGLGRVTVDRFWRIHADPETVARATVPQLGGELVHLTTHLLRDHAGRAAAVGLREQAEVHHWVDAADAEVADDVPADLERISPGPAPADLDRPEGRLAEEYYRTGSVRDETNDCGSGAHGQLAPHEPPPPGEDEPGVGPADQELVRRQVAAAVAEADGVADGLRSWARDRLEPTVDWRTELAALLRRAVSTVAGAVDYSYRRPSRRAAATPGVILPALRRPAVEVAVVCDTSASVGDDLLAAAVAEVAGLLRAVGTRTIRVLACDDAVRATTRVTTVDELVLLGGGGTDLGVGLDAALRLRPAPQVIVVLTDGYTPWPAATPRAEIVVGILDSDQPVPPPPPPRWSRSVSIRHP